MNRIDTVWIVLLTLALAGLPGSAHATWWNAVEDPSFELGGPGNPHWNEFSISSPTLFVNDPAAAHTGNWFVAIGSDDAMTEQASLSQEVELGDFEAHLSFKLKRELVSNNDQDVFSVQVDGIEVFREEIGTNSSPTSWTMIGPIDLTTFADGGLHTVEVLFDGTSMSTTGTGTLYFLDDVELETRNTPVVAEFSWGPVNAQVGEQVQFHDESTGGVDQWEWQIDGAFFSDDPLPVYVFTEPGEFAVKLIVTRTSDGAMDWIEKFVTIEAPLTADFAWNPLVPTPGETVHFYETALGNPEWWQWEMPDGTIVDGPEANWVFPEPGEYQVTLTVGKAARTEITDSVTKNVTIDPEDLVADFEWVPEVPEAGDPVQFLDQTKGGPDVWVWHFGDGATSSAPSPTHVFQEPGVFDVELTVQRTADGSSSTRTHTVTVEGPDLVADFAWAPNAPQVGQPIQFSDRSTGEPDSWTWSFGDGATSTQENPEHAYADPGTYPVTLTVARRNDPSSGASLTQNVVVAEGELTAWFGWQPEDPKAGQDIQFVDESAGDPVAWQWSFGDGATATGENPVHAFAEPGEYQAGLRVTDEFGNSSEVQRRIAVTPSAGTPDFTWEPEIPLAGSLVQFFDLSDGDPGGWQWDFGDGTTSLQRNPAHRFTAPGEYPVTLSVRYGSAASSIREVTHVVHVAEPLVARFQWAPAIPMVDEPVEFFDVSLGDPQAWFWEFGDGATSEEPAPVHAYASSGLYPVTLTVAGGPNGDVTDTVTREILVADPVDIDFTWTPEAPRARQPVSFEPVIDGQPAGLAWFFGDGNHTEGPNPTHVYEFPGTFLVQLVAWNADGSVIAVAENEVHVAPPDLDFELEFTNRDPLRGEEVGVRIQPNVPVDGVVWEFGGVNCSGDDEPIVCQSGPGQPCHEASWRWATHGPKPVRAFITVDGVEYLASSSVRVHPEGGCGGPPQAAFGWWPESPRAGQEVRCVDRSSGPPEEWTWRFPSGDTTAEQHPEWTFWTPGDYEVELTVRNAAGSSTITRTITVAPGEDVCGDGFCGATESTWTCREDCGPPADSESGRTGRKHTNLMIPAAAGSVAGAAGSNWFTEGMLFNPNLAEAEVVLEFRPDGGGVSQVAGPVVLPPRTGLRFDNLLGEAFGTEGVGSVALDATLPVIIDTRTYNLTEQGTMGQGVGAITRDETIGANEGAVYLAGLTQTDDFRTNLILHEVTGQTATAEVELFSASGELLATQSVAVPGHDRWQKPISQLWPEALDHGSARITIQGAGRMAIMASVIDQRTNDATSIDAVHLKQVSATTTAGKTEAVEPPHFLVAVVARTPGTGRTFWRSEVSILNPEEEQQTLILEYYPSGGELQTATVDVGAGATYYSTDIVGEVFGDAGEGSGAFHVYSEGAAIVNSRTYNLTDADETVGQSIPGLSEGDMARPGETWLLNNLRDDEDFRCNMGFAEFSGTDSEVTVVLFDNNNMALRYLATKTYTVEAFGTTQINRIFKDMGLQNEYREVIAYIAVGEDSGAVYSYASIVDNGVGDATTILAKRQ